MLVFTIMSLYSVQKEEKLELEIFLEMKKNSSRK